jgi:mRNA-degrading endonuclease YafQ of YafQ-DinJ toxin-antitoxin module
LVLGDDLRVELRSCPKVERKQVGALIQRLQESFGDPHLHSGIGIRDLSPKGNRLRVYECRLGRALRLIFTLERPSLLYFHMIGTHDDVRRYLKSFL